MSRLIGWSMFWGEEPRLFFEIMEFTKQLGWSDGITKMLWIPLPFRVKLHDFFLFSNLSSRTAVRPVVNGLTFLYCNMKTLPIAPAVDCFNNVVAFEKRDIVFDFVSAPPYSSTKDAKFVTSWCWSNFIPLKTEWVVASFYPIYSFIVILFMFLPTCEL